MQLGKVVGVEGIRIPHLRKRNEYAEQSKINSFQPTSSINLNANPSTIHGRILVQQPKQFQNPQIDLTKRLEKFIENDRYSETPIIKEVKNPDFITKIAQKVTETPEKSIIIGLSGESASGKSTIRRTLEETANQLGLSIETIEADNYFNDISDLIKKYGSFGGVIDSGYDVDSPSNFNLDLLRDDLVELSNGNDVKIPEYKSDGTGVSRPNKIPKKSERIILVEGIATMYEPVRSILDAEIYVDIDPKVQEERYVVRAQADRNQTEDEAISQLAYVREAAAKYILPKRDESDIIIDGAVSKDEYKEKLIDLFYLLK